MEVWDRSFAKLSYSIVNARCRYLCRLAPFGEEIYRNISGGKEAFTMAYQCSVPGDWGQLGEQEGEELILQRYSLSSSISIRDPSASVR